MKAEGNGIQGFPKERILFTAIRGLDYSLVKKILQTYTDMVNYSRQGDGFTPLHRAVYTNKEKMVNLLLDLKANPNKPSKIETLTPLALALKTADTKPSIIQILIYYAEGFVYEDIVPYNEQRLKLYRNVGSLDELINGKKEKTTNVKKKYATTPPNDQISWSKESLQSLKLAEELCNLKRPSPPIGKNSLLGQRPAEVKTDVREPLSPNLAKCSSDIESPELPIGPGSPVSKSLLGGAGEPELDALDKFHTELVELD